jgi:N-acetylmuramoyl-L-alanine amidase
LIDDLQRVDRGFKRARFKVLKGLECPGVLVECGFVSNDKEALLLNTPVYRQKLADSLARSLGDFAKSREGEKRS